MENAVKTYISGFIEKKNLFTLLQLFWLIEFYFLGINKAVGLVINLFQIQKELPNSIVKYNEIALSYLSEYEVFIFVLAPALLLCGIVGAFINKINILAKYKLVNIYADFGIYGGLWLLLIGFTYRIFCYSGYLFFCIPILVVGLVEILIYIREKLKDKGITFEL